MERSSPRRYTAAIPALPHTTVLFQRAGDIPLKVEEGSADLGISGLDRFLELRVEGGESVLIVEDLGFGRCELVIAIPDSWVDVTSMADLADLSMEMRERGKELRVATKYPRLVQRHLFRCGVNYFSLVQSSGTLEAAPAMGFADVIADISSSGITLRENRLKTLEDGSILASQACLIGNKRLLARDQPTLQEAKGLLEHVEGYLRARDFFSVTANIRGDSPEEVAAHVIERPELAGLKGPTTTKVYSSGADSWYAVTVVVPRDRLFEALEHLRQIGGGSITVFQPHYVFQDQCASYQALLQALDS
ncbi:MAG: phosphoribosyltransferase [Dehalococcoidia bacterium]|nr:phosphoribosyltransferase [Dehalococcoidia bacterium]